MAKHDTWLAKSQAEKEVFATVSPDGDGVLSIAKQIDCTNQDVVNEKCVHNDAGVLVLTHAHSMHLTIVTCYIKACETELPNNLHLFSSCLNGEHRNQNTHQSWDAGEEGVELARQLTEADFNCGVITSDWEESFLLNLYNGKSGALDRGNYSGLKLTDEGIKLLERVLHLWDVNMQVGLVPGRGITDAIFVVCQLQEKYITANKLLYFFTLPLSTLRKPSVVFQGRSYGMR